MLESITLVDVLLLLIYDRWVSRKHDRLDKVCGVINFGDNLLLVDASVAFLDFILSLHLDHFAALANKVKPSSHHFGLLPLNHEEALELNEAHVLDRALHRHVDHCRHFGQYG